MNLNDELSNFKEEGFEFELIKSSNILMDDLLSNKLSSAIIDGDIQLVRKYIKLGAKLFHYVTKQSFEVDGDGKVCDYDENQMSAIEVLFSLSDKNFVKLVFDEFKTLQQDKFSNVLDVAFIDSGNNRVVRQDINYLMSFHKRIDLIPLLATYNYFDNTSIEDILSNAIEVGNFDFIKDLCKNQAINKIFLTDEKILNRSINSLFS